MSSEEGVGKKRGGGESGETQPRAAPPRLPILAPVRRATAPRRTPHRANPGLEATNTQPLGSGFSPEGPAAAYSGHRCRLQPRERTVPRSRPLHPGPQGSSPSRGAAAGRGCSRVGCTIRLFCSSLLRPGFIVCGAFWGWGGSCASATAAAAAVASATRTAGRRRLGSGCAPATPASASGFPSAASRRNLSSRPPEGHRHHGLTWHLPGIPSPPTPPLLSTSSEDPRVHCGPPIL